MVKIPAVQKAVKKVASQCSTCGKKSSDDMLAEGYTLKETLAEENTVKEELEVKPLVVGKKPPKNRDGDPVLTVEMKPLKFYPAKKILPTARCGKPFRRGTGGGDVIHTVSEDEKKMGIDQDSVSVIVSDDESNKQSDDNIPKEGEASIETNDTPYETWLAVEGLMRLKESKENIRKKNDKNEKSVEQKKKDTNKNDLPVQPVTQLKIDKVDDSGDQKTVDDSGDQKEVSVSSDEKKGENLIDKLEKFKDEVKVMISQGKGEEYSEEKINKLKTILN